MIIRNLEEAEAALRPHVLLVKQLTGKHTTLKRIRPLMELLGNPQDKLKIIHIAGTSGKTSTAYYMAALLRAANLKVGLTVSPHVDSVTERVQINGQPLSEAEFCNWLGEFMDIIERAEQKPSYFELLYAFAIWVFALQKVDYAVIETGVGGLHDATNVAARRDKVCVITDIGFDHEHLLGRTLPEIAAQKAGIIHDGNHVFTYRQQQGAMTVIEQWADQHGAPLHIVDNPGGMGSGGMPAYQQRNWQLARQVYEYLRLRDKLPELTDRQLKETRTVNVPGRMDIKRVNGKTLIMDGAHNAQKTAAFIDSFKRLYPAARPAILLSMKDGKEYLEVVDLLAALAGRVIVTTFNTTQDLPVASMDPGILTKAFEKAGIPVELESDQRAALRKLLSGPEDICVMTGSFYMLSQIRNNSKL